MGADALGPGGRRWSLRRQLSRPLVASVIWSIGLRGAGMLASFLLGVQLARFLGPAGFGIYGVAIALALTLSVVAQLGLPTLAVREIAVAMETRNWPVLRGVLTWFPRVVLLGAAVAGIGLLAGILLYPRATGDQLPHELLLAVPLVPLFALTVLVGAELRALDRLVAGQSLDIFVRPVLACAGCFGLYLVAQRLTAEWALLVNLAASLIALALGIAWRRSAEPPDARLASPTTDRKGWTRAALPLAVSEVFLQLNGTYGMLIAGAFATGEQAGFLRVALSTIVFIATPISTLNVVLAPRLAQLYGTGQSGQLQRLLSHAAAAMFAVTLVALGFIAAVGRPLLGFIFGAGYVPSWPPLLLLVLAQVIIGFFGVGWVLLSMCGMERKLGLAYMISVPVSIAAAIPLTRQFGATGAASAAVLGALVQNLLCWHFLRRRLGLESSVAGLFIGRPVDAR